MSYRTPLGNIFHQTTKQQTPSEIFGTPTSLVTQDHKDQLLLSFFKLFANNLFEKFGGSADKIDISLAGIKRVLSSNFPLVTWTQIELDSTYRNRKLYPLSSDFVVNFVNSGNNFFNSLDPVFEAVPYETNLTQAGSTTTQIVLSTNSNSLNNFYVNNTLYINQEFTTIKTYNGTTRTAMVSPALTSAPLVNTRYFIQSKQPVISGNLVAATSTTVTLPLSANNVTDYYKGMYLYMLSGNSIEFGSVITSYNSTTQIATLQNTFSVLPSVGDIFEISNFSYDNCQTYRYNGTKTITQPAAYAISITQLSIPRQILKVGYGGYVSDYPYVLVQFSNANNHSSGIMYGNTPAAENATFKVPLNASATTPYFLIAQNVNVTTPQVMKFFPGEAIKFKVTLPNGDPLQFETNEYFSPLAPNPFVQIGCMVAIQRLPIPLV
jgi:hypothetical protein